MEKELEFEHFIFASCANCGGERFWKLWLFKAKTFDAQALAEGAWEEAAAGAVGARCAGKEQDLTFCSPAQGLKAKTRIAEFAAGAPSEAQELANRAMAPAIGAMAGAGLFALAEWEGKTGSGKGLISGHGEAAFQLALAWNRSQLEQGCASGAPAAASKKL